MRERKKLWVEKEKSDRSLLLLACPVLVFIVFKPYLESIAMVTVHVVV